MYATIALTVKKTAKSAKDAKGKPHFNPLRSLRSLRFAVRGGLAYGDRDRAAPAIRGAAQSPAADADARSLHRGLLRRAAAGALPAADRPLRAKLDDGRPGLNRLCRRLVAGAAVLRLAGRPHQHPPDRPGADLDGDDV